MGGARLHLGGGRDTEAHMHTLIGRKSRGITQQNVKSKIHNEEEKDTTSSFPVAGSTTFAATSTGVLCVLASGGATDTDSALREPSR